MSADSRRGAIRVALVLVAAALAVLAAVSAWHHHESIARGRALFNGETALVGRIEGQSDSLPTAAIRCSNCHAASPARTAEGGGSPKGDFLANGGGSPSAYAVPLDRAALTTLRSRRGGPASRFDEPSMCALVRSGIDPAHIIIPQAMPHYDITDRDCSALWDYLTTL